MVAYYEQPSPLRAAMPILNSPLESAATRTSIEQPLGITPAALPPIPVGSDTIRIDGELIDPKKDADQARLNVVFDFLGVNNKKELKSKITEIVKARAPQLTNAERKVAVAVVMRDLTGDETDLTDLLLAVAAERAASDPDAQIITIDTSNPDIYIPKSTKSVVEEVKAALRNATVVPRNESSLPNQPTSAASVVANRYFRRQSLSEPIKSINEDSKGSKAVNTGQKLSLERASVLDGFERLRSSVIKKLAHDARVMPQESASHGTQTPNNATKPRTPRFSAANGVSTPDSSNSRVMTIATTSTLPPTATPRSASPIAYPPAFTSMERLDLWLDDVLRPISELLNRENVPADVVGVPHSNVGSGLTVETIRDASPIRNSLVAPTGASGVAMGTVLPAREDTKRVSSSITPRAESTAITNGNHVDIANISIISANMAPEPVDGTRTTDTIVTDLVNGRNTTFSPILGTLTAERKGETAEGITPSTTGANRALHPATSPDTSSLTSTLSSTSSGVSPIVSATSAPITAVPRSTAPLNTVMPASISSSSPSGPTSPSSNTPTSSTTTPPTASASNSTAPVAPLSSTTSASSASSLRVVPSAGSLSAAPTLPAVSLPTLPGLSNGLLPRLVLPMIVDPEGRIINLPRIPVQDVMPSQASETLRGLESGNTGSLTDAGQNSSASNSRVNPTEVATASNTARNEESKSVSTSTPTLAVTGNLPADMAVMMESAPRVGTVIAPRAIGLYNGTTSVMHVRRRNSSLPIDHDSPILITRNTAELLSKIPVSGGLPRVSSEIDAANNQREFRQGSEISTTSPLDATLIDSIVPITSTSSELRRLDSATNTNSPRSFLSAPEAPPPLPTPPSLPPLPSLPALFQPFAISGDVSSDDPANQKQHPTHEKGIPVETSEYFQSPPDPSILLKSKPLLVFNAQSSKKHHVSQTSTLSGTEGGAETPRHRNVLPLLNIRKVEYLNQPQPPYEHKASLSGLMRPLNAWKRHFSRKGRTVVY